MILSKEQLTEIETLARPLADWIKANAYPHCAALVNEDHVELIEGVCYAPIKPIGKDNSGKD